MTAGLDATADGGTEAAESDRMEVEEDEKEDEEDVDDDKGN